MKIDEYKQYFKQITDEVNVKRLHFDFYKCDGFPLILVYKAKDTLNEGDNSQDELFLEYKGRKVISKKLNDLIPEFCEKILK